MDRTALVQALDQILEPGLTEDSTYNGLQVEGKADIKRVGFAVDSCLPVFEQAAEQGCDMLVVHHGLIWGGWKRITGPDRQKLDILLRAGINLYVSHLPLDRHPVWGNNVRIIQKLEGQIHSPVLEVGFSASQCNRVTRTEFRNMLSERIGLLNSLEYGPEKIGTYAVSSGSFRPGWLATLAQQGIDTVITGEGASPSLMVYPAQETAMNVYFCGHYNTEVFGVQGLQEYLQKNFPEVQTLFLDVPTGW